MVLDKEKLTAIAELNDCHYTLHLILIRYKFRK